MPYSARSPDGRFAWRCLKSRYPSGEAWLLSVETASGMLAVNVLLRWIVS